jgi:hypothetical protein
MALLLPQSRRFQTLPILTPDQKEALRRALQAGVKELGLAQGQQASPGKALQGGGLARALVRDRVDQTSVEPNQAELALNSLDLGQVQQVLNPSADLPPTFPTDKATQAGARAGARRAATRPPPTIKAPTPVQTPPAETVAPPAPQFEPPGVAPNVSDVEIAQKSIADIREAAAASGGPDDAIVKGLKIGKDTFDPAPEQAPNTVKRGSTLKLSATGKAFGDSDDQNALTEATELIVDILTILGAPGRPSG